MQTMSRESGGGGGDPVRTPQSTHSVHVGNSEPGLPSLQLLQSLSEENTLVSKQKKDAGGGEVAPRKGGRLPHRGTLSPSKGIEVVLSEHVPRETATGGKMSGKPPIAAGIAAFRMVVEGRDHVRTRGGLNTDDGDFPKRSGDASDEVTCSCDGCTQARGTCLSWGTGVRAQAGCECGRR